MKTKHARVALAMATGLALAVAWQSIPMILPPTASAAEGPLPSGTEGVTRYVAPDGDDAHDCGSVANRCRTIQRAVDVAETGDLVLVATGTYTGVRHVPSLSTSQFTATQVVVITKTITLRGGFTTTDWTTYDPTANPTTLDAEGVGRVLAFKGSGATPVVEGLHITGGDATGLMGTGSGDDVGGGMYVSAANPTISDCVVFSNTASRTGRGYGGGLYVSSAATVTASTIQSNTAARTDIGYGGGVCLFYWDAMLSDSIVQGNTASLGGKGYGGGVYLFRAAPTLRANVVQSNTASTSGAGYGGGVFMSEVDGATLSGNTIRWNIASTDGSGYGGGVIAMSSDNVAIGENRIEENRATTAVAGAFGGGFRATTSDGLIMTGNLVKANVAGTLPSGTGGGISLDSCEHGTLTGNTIISNVASLEPSAGGKGGGVHVSTGGPFTFTNNLVARNHANAEGGGFYFTGWLHGRLWATLTHNTIADNACELGSDGVKEDNHTTLAFANTIISGHAEKALWVNAASSATLEATLWYGNGDDAYGEGDIGTGVVVVHDDPRFVDPDAFDYHIGSDSAAIDAGIDVGVTEDIDGDPRPAGAAPDIGADEFRLHCVYLPLITRN